MPDCDDDSSVVSYELQIDDGNGGEFRSLGGFDKISMQTKYSINNLQTGQSYRLRYRVLNSVGWSTFSPILNALVASAPGTPAAPRLISATSTSITLGFSESLFNGGAGRLNYELWMDNGYGTPFT